MNDVDDRIWYAAAGALLALVIAQLSERVRAMEIASAEKVAAGTQSALQAPQQAASAVKERAHNELDTRVIQPLKTKAITYAALGLLALTLWIALIAWLVGLAFGL